MRGKAKAYKKLGEAVRGALHESNGLRPAAIVDVPVVKIGEVKEAIARFGISYDPCDLETRFMTALIKFWRANKRPPTHDEWAEQAGLRSCGRTSSAIKKLCISGKVIRIGKGKWQGKYVPAK